MTDHLDLWPREHDLPPRWDGYPVQWGEWSPALEGLFICPPPKPEKCSYCGSMNPPKVISGRFSVPYPDGVVRIKLARLRAQPDNLPAGYLTLFRCPDCTRDHVIDQDGNNWDLDPTDYTSGGSYDQAGA